jgi:hypothetical protein
MLFQADINNLKNYYIHHVNVTLPIVSVQQQWPIKYNHCFARIILDNVFEDCWYKHLDRTKVAYQQLSYDELLKANKIIQLLILDRTKKAINILNARSFKYRNY